MAQLIVMPKFGLTMTEGTIASWNVTVGDTIAEGDILCEIETDKLTNEFESPKSGVLLKIIEGDGATVTCLEPIAIIGEANEDISGLSGGTTPQAAEEAAPIEVTVRSETSAKTAGGRINASPLAKKLAKEKGIDLSLITGTGAKGSITVDDVNNYTPVAEADLKISVSPVAKKMAETSGLDLSTVTGDGRIMKKRCGSPVN